MGFDGDAPRAWGEDESEAFAEFGRAMVPGREEIERTLLGLLPAGRDEPFVGVEIGTGTGWLSAAVLREFPNARLDEPVQGGGQKLEGGQAALPGPRRAGGFAEVVRRRKRRPEQPRLYLGEPEVAGTDAPQT